MNPMSKDPCTNPMIALIRSTSTIFKRSERCVSENIYTYVMEDGKKHSFTQKYIWDFEKAVKKHREKEAIHPCAEIIKDDFKMVRKYVELLDLQSDFKHSCAISDMVWRGLQDTPYSCGYDTLAGRTSLEDRERAI